jgi:hypothetical protein
LKSIEWIGRIVELQVHSVCESLQNVYGELPQIVEVDVSDKRDAASILVPHSNAGKPAVSIEWPHIEVRNTVSKQSWEFFKRSRVDGFNVTIDDNVDCLASLRMAHYDDFREFLMASQKFTNRVGRTFVREYKHAQ